MILSSLFPEVRNSTPICVLCSVMYRKLANLVGRRFHYILTLDKAARRKFDSQPFGYWYRAVVDLNNSLIIPTYSHILILTIDTRAEAASLIAAM